MCTRRSKITLLATLTAIGATGLPACGDNINVAPTAIDGTITTNEDTEVTFTLGGVDPNGDEALFRDIGEPQNGRLDLDDLPEVTYIPNLNFNGNDQFTFSVSDGLLSATGTVNIIVVAVNDAPTISPIVDITTQSSALDVPFTVGDVDNAVEELIVTATSGDETVVPNANLVFAGGTDANRFLNVAPAAPGVATITVTVSDGELESSEVFDYTVTNQGPTVVADTYDGFGNTQLVVDAASGVLANDTDPEGDTITATVATVATTEGGSVDIAADGSFVYTPAVGSTAVTDTFLYEATDGFVPVMQNASVDLTDLVWYVDNTAGAGGDGRDTSRFNTLVAAEAAANPGDAIFVFAGDGLATGQNDGIALTDNQRLIGEAAGLTLSATVLVAPGGRPLLTAVASDVINLADGNVVTGIALTVPAGGRGIAEANLTGLTLDNVSITNLVGNDSIDIGNNNPAATVNITITNCSINTDLASDDAIDVTVAGTNGGNLVLDISNNTFTSTEGSPIRVDLDGNTGTGTPNNISITGNTGTFAIDLGPDDTSVSDIVVDNNIASGGTATARVVNVRVSMATSGLANLTVSNNTLSTATSECIQAIGNTTGGGGDGTLVSLIDGNTFTSCVDPIRMAADDTTDFSTTVTNNTSTSAGAMIIDFVGNTGAVHNVFFTSNESVGGFELQRDATGQINLGGSLGQGFSFDDDNGNIAGDGNTSSGGAPIVTITGGALNQITIIDPTTIPTP